MIAASGVFRSWEMDVSRAERSRSASTRRFGLVQILAQMDALDRDCRLIHQRVEQAGVDPE